MQADLTFIDHVIVHDLKLLCLVPVGAEVLEQGQRVDRDKNECADWKESAQACRVDIWALEVYSNWMSIDVELFEKAQESYHI